MDETRKARELIDATHRATLLFWSGDADDAPVGGDTVSMGHTGMVPEESSWTRDRPEYVEVPVTAWGDYSGSTVERSNCRALREDYPETFVTVTGGYSSEYLALPADADIPEHLFDALVDVSENYPLYDERDHSALEMTLQDEAWDCGGSDDFRDAIVKHLGAPDDTCIDPAELYDLYRAACDVGNIYPVCEDAVSAWLYPDDAGSIAADILLREYMTRPECEGQLSLV